MIWIKLLFNRKGIRRMEQCITQNEHLPIISRDVLTEILRHGAQEMLAQAIENEVAEYVEAHAHTHDDQGRRLVVRNGYLPSRTIRTGVGPVDVRQPRVNDKRIDEDGRRMRFSSTILPPYLRRTRSIDELIPWLYLKGVSTGDFTDALKASSNSGNSRQFRVRPFLIPLLLEYVRFLIELAWRSYPSQATSLSVLFAYSPTNCCLF